MNVGVDRIHAGRAHAHDDLARTGFRIRDLFELQNVGPAELMDSD
jgi:hypothetical protein